MKTEYSSYCLNSIPEGCKFCVKGKKLVLFISGQCSRNCWYCSLSKKRKNIDKIWVNERQVNSVKEMIQETRESNAKGAGITGGDPLLCLNRTLKYVEALKQTFGKRFHIHIYLPTKLVNKNNLAKLSRYVDEVRFHPSFLIDNVREISDFSEHPKNPTNKQKGFFDSSKDIEKIKLAGLFWKKQNIGIELPLLPDKKKEILNFINKAKNHIGFVNLNELEISDTNFNFIIKKYKLNSGGYTVKDSIGVGLWTLQQLKKQKTKLKIHLCTAELKNNFQFKNRLKRHKIMKYGKKTGEGLVIYFVVEYKNDAGKMKLINKFKNKCYVDEAKKRLVVKPSLVRRLMKDYRIFRVEEYPTYDTYEVERSEI